MWDIQLFKLNFDERERQAAASVVDGGWLTMGEKCAAFETAFSDFLGGNTTCLAVSSCTAALHMALLAADVQPGDEVVIPALTFVADANVVRMIGAKPVVADCADLDNWNMTAQSIAACITDKTKAVIVVHFAGFPAEMRDIAALCQARNLFLIEDVAHAIGGSVADKSCGTWGDVGCFSFFSNKNLSVGEGGMCTTRNSEIAQRLRHLRSHGMSSLTLDRHKGRSASYEVIAPGLNYRFDEIRSAIGLVQLDKLPAANASRAELVQHYRQILAQTNVATVPFADIPADHVSSYHIMPVLLPVGCDRAGVIAAMKQERIQTSIHYPAFWDFAAYSQEIFSDDAPAAAEICRRELTLPLYPGLTFEEVDRVCAALKRAIDANLSQTSEGEP